MKKILVALDFSEQSTNAVHYAAKMALETNSRLIFLHVYDNMAPAIENPIAVEIPDSEKEILEELGKIEKKINDQYGNKIVMQCVARLGFVVDEINTVAVENNVDLVIMGMQGAGFLSERLLGSITNLVIRKSKKPVLVIDKHMQYKKPEKILLATDGKKLKNDATFEVLKDLMNNFKSHLYIVHILHDPDLKNNYDDLEFFKLDEGWMHHSLSFHHIVHEDTIEGLNEFVNIHDVDMLVMIPHKHDFFSRILKEPHTQKMVFHSIAPVLTLIE